MCSSNKVFLSNKKKLFFLFSFGGDFPRYECIISFLKLHNSCLHLSRHSLLVGIPFCIVHNAFWHHSKALTYCATHSWGFMTGFHIQTEEIYFHSWWFCSGAKSSWALIKLPPERLNAKHFSAQMRVVSKAFYFLRSPRNFSFLALGKEKHRMKEIPRDFDAMTVRRNVSPLRRDWNFHEITKCKFI